MADIRPFRGFIYNPERFSDLSPLLSPPYDVISPSQRDDLASRSPYNMVNLTLGCLNQNGETEQPFYARAAHLWNGWRNESILVQVGEPGVWVIRETFTTPEDELLHRQGFVALVKLEEFSPMGIQRHEQTLRKPKEDRLRLMESTKANLSPVFFIYSDDKGEGETILNNVATTPTRCVLDLDGKVNIDCLRTSDGDVISKLTRLLSEKAVLIADGHHRYETALHYHKRQDFSPNLDTSCVMGYFVSTASEGLRILPTHRSLHSFPHFDVPSFLAKCRDFFLISDAGENVQVADGAIPRFRCLLNENLLFTFVLKHKYHDMLKSRLSPSELASFDTVALEEFVFKEILGLSAEEIENQKHITYFHRNAECLHALKYGKAQLAFLMNPISANLLMKAVSKGGILPQKTTFFYPKTTVGLVMYSLERT